MLQSIIQSRQIQLAVLSKLEFFDTVRASEEIGNRVSLPDLPEFVLLKLHFWKYITRNQFAFRVIPGRFQLRTGRFCESPSSVEKRGTLIFLSRSRRQLRRFARRRCTVIRKIIYSCLRGSLEILAGFARNHFVSNQLVCEWDCTLCLMYLVLVLIFSHRTLFIS